MLKETTELTTVEFGGDGGGGGALSSLARRMRQVSSVGWAKMASADRATVPWQSQWLIEEDPVIAQIEVDLPGCVDSGMQFQLPGSPPTVL